ncbi:MAG TPA: hypothetical protein VLB46_02950 [Pyrinomonadaceae bacterium]|nr:hypothetical protein [Pyrinomonadaceae bacterium]
MLGTLNDSTILRLRVKGSDLDPLALRGRLENVLNDVSLQPRLPPSATLFIRKLADPLPGSIRLDSPHARAPLAWRHAFQTRFDQLVSSAARPAHGFVADSAESVVFYDYAELLACLTADWCSGVAMTRWWWQALIKRGDIARMIRQFWREKIEYVPPALEFLVRKGVVVEFVSRLSDGEVLEIFERVVRVFGVTRIERIKATDFFSVVMAREVTHVSVAEMRREMPWKRVVPESDTPRLRPVQQLFVGVVLMVHRAPSRVRTVSFAREVERWIEQVVSPAPEQQIIVEDRIESDFSPAPETPAPIRENPIHITPELPRPAPRPKESVKSAVTLSNATFTYEEFTAIPEVEPESETLIAEPELVVEPEEKPEVFVAPSPTPLDDVTIETELGGLFYLINLALFMEIYSDFTSPVERFHDDLSIWDFVAIVGKEIDPESIDDPIWNLLRSFADRDDQDELTTPSWLAELLPHIRARLHLALGIDDDLAPVLLHHHAKISITPAHLDVFFSLADHPIEIRLSGLDRNPGWVPAAGRFIAFHYD